MLTVLALIFGELATLAGLYLAWPPLTLIVAGVQLVAWALTYDPKPSEVVR